MGTDGVGHGKPGLNEWRDEQTKGEREEELIMCGH